MFKTLRLISIMSVFVLIISACNLPSNAATPNPKMNHTQLQKGSFRDRFFISTTFQIAFAARSIR